MKVDILTYGLGIFPSRAFLLPILSYRDSIESAGIKISISYTPQDIDYDCDVLIVEDNSFNRKFETEDYIPKTRDLADSVDRLLWFDTSDSTGTITSDVLPIVDGYYKKQLLINREQYCEPQWRDRLFTDYYYDNYDLNAEGINNEPQVYSKSDLEKLGVFWNLGYELYFPFWNQKNAFFKLLPKSISEQIPWKRIQTLPSVWQSPRTPRDVSISGRFSTSHDDRAVRFHRNLMIKNVKQKVKNNNINTLGYWQELRNAKVLLSPFGWGEICHRDFEGFLSGCLVIKPKMDHMNTWPPLYQAGETMLAVDWDMNGLENKIKNIIKDDKKRKEIAQKGQQRYRHYVTGQTAATEFVKRFETIITNQV